MACGRAEAEVEIGRNSHRQQLETTAGEAFFDMNFPSATREAGRPRIRSGRLTDSCCS